MAGIKFKVSYNRKNINKINNNIKNCFVRAAERLMIAIKQAQVIPYDTGATQDSLKVEASKQAGRVEVHLSTSTNYSDDIYWHPEYNFKRTKNKNAKGRWFDEWIWGDKSDDFRKYFEEELKEEMKKQ